MLLDTKYFQAGGNRSKSCWTRAGGVDLQPVDDRKPSRPIVGLRKKLLSGGYGACLQTDSDEPTGGILIK